MLHDPAVNRFYSLSWTAFEILSRWPLQDPSRVLAAVNAETTLCIDEEDLHDVVKFLAQFHLLDALTAVDSARLLESSAASRLSVPKWLLKNYLFLRVPLVHPAAWLARWAPRVAWVFHPLSWLGILVAALVGLALASRQWDTFIGTFAQYKSWSGILSIGIALSIAKVLHELGHAFTAQRFGCRVSTMGVAFLVMLPVLYTDTNEAWKLADKGDRLKIAAAGVLAELALAALATLAWNFLPDGPIRAAVFLLATTTWIVTVAINASPFMRFDGYFLLCDYLDIANLHSRAFALGRWRLREWLFAWGDQPPESFSAGRQRFLIVFAFATWCYRLGVFLGIAYLVYDSFFKLLGVALLFVELGYFILLPVANEVHTWWERRTEFSWNVATARTVALCACVATIMFVPWRQDVRAPAILGAAQSQDLYAVSAARSLDRPVAVGSVVKAGDVLLRLDSPDLINKLGLARSNEAALRDLVQLQPLNDKLLGEGAALRERFAAATAEVNGLVAQIELLTVRAPFDGRVVDVNESLTPGAWVAQHERLMHISGWMGAKGEVLVEEADLARIVGTRAVFVAERAENSVVKCRLGDIDRINLSALDTPYLASTYGGAIRVQPDQGGALIPVETLFRARLVDCTVGAAPLQELRGTAHLLGDPKSFARLGFKYALRAVQRELGR